MSYIFKNKYILLISPEPWSHIHVSKHHYALELANRNNQVYFLNPPRVKGFHITRVNPNLCVIDYPGLTRGLYLMPKFIRMKEQKSVYARIAQLAQCDFGIIWSFDNSVFYDFDAFPANSSCISHIVDLSQDFQTRRAAGSANMCLGVTKEIVERLARYNRNTHLIPHGVHLYPSDPAVPLPGKNLTKALYFGNLAMPHLHWDLLASALAKYPQIDFVLIGPNHQQVRLDSKNNLHFLDAVPSEALYRYMSSAQLLLLFYTSDYLKAYASPHKMLEYLASGKPIVSNSFPDYRCFADLIYQSDNCHGWLDNLETALNEADVEKVKRRKEIAEMNTYSQRIDQIEQLLKNNV